jgi:protein gp37
VSVAQTAISWCDSTWGPVRGCTKAGPACKNCYAARQASRFPWGEGFAEKGEWTGRVELIESALDQPLHWRKPKVIFVASMSDVFHDSLTDHERDRIFAGTYLADQHTYLSLTKRPENQRRYVSDPSTPFRIQRAIDAMSVDEEIRWKKEKWLPIPGCPYEASSFGRVRREGRILAQSVHSHGYRQVAISINGKPKTRLVHQLVLEAFAARPYGTCEVAHKNGNKADNRIANLRWTSKAGNMADAARHGTAGCWMKGRGILSWDQVLEIRERRKRGEKLDDIAVVVGSTRKQVSAVALGGIYKGASLQWPPTNVWLGVSCWDQESADRMIPELLATPAAHRFVSLEPLLGPVDFAFMRNDHGYGEGQRWYDPLRRLAWVADYSGYEDHCHCREGLDAVVVGGETIIGGPRSDARPCDISWVRSIKRQCDEASVPMHFKQTGPGISLWDGLGRGRRVYDRETGEAWMIRHHSGADPSEWPEDLRAAHGPGSLAWRVKP